MGAQAVPTQIERLEALAGHLLDGYLALRERNAIVSPLLFDKETAEFYGSGKRSRGFRVLRNSLFLSCIQDIAKLTADSDERTPSVSKFVKALSEPALKWSDVGKVTLLLQVPVAAIGHLVRCTSFAWDMLEEQLSRAANDFWIINYQAV